MMMKESPRNCQIVITATAGRAHVVLSRAGGVGLIPNHGRRPTTGFKRVPKTTEATATELTTVEEKIMRYTAMPLSFRCAATARAKPRTRLVGTTRTTKTSVVKRLCVNWVELRTGPIWCSPT